MRKVIVAGLTAGLVLTTTGCTKRPLAYYFDKTKPISAVSVKDENLVASVSKETQIDADSLIDKKRLQDEMKDKHHSIEGLKDVSYGMAVSITSAAVSGNNPAVANIIGYAIDYAIKEGLDKMHKDSYVIIPLYENKDLKTKNKEFQLVVYYQDEKQAEDFKTFLAYNDKFGLIGKQFNSAIKLTPEERPNKVVFYLVKFEGDPKAWRYQEIYPFIHTITEIYIDNQLAGRYMLYGNAVRAFFFGDFNRKKTTVIIEAIFTKPKGFLNNTIKAYLDDKS